MEEQAQSTCDICKEPLDEDGDICSIGYTISTCYPCYESELEYASTAWIVQGGEVTKLIVTDYGAIDEYNDTWLGEPDITRNYTSTDAWRGYQTTRPRSEDYEQVTFQLLLWGEKNDGARRLENLLEEPSQLVASQPVVFTFDPTSNVFAQHVHLYAHKVDAPRIKQLIGGGE